MNRQKKIFHYNNIALAYTIYGHGDKKIVAFYGFNQGDLVFQQYARTLEDGHQLYCIDLFYHGRSIWPYGQKALSKALWKEIFLGFMTHEGIQAFSMIGFSMGAKVLLATLEAFPKAVKSVTMIAPDGIRLNPWYKLATTLPPLTSIFRYMINHPSLFYKLISLLERLHLGDKSLLRFAKSQMKTKALRSKVFHSWMVYRSLSFSSSSLADIINQQKIPTTIILGDADKVIKYKHVKVLLDKIVHYDLRIIPANHYNLLRRALRNE